MFATDTTLSVCFCTGTDVIQMQVLGVSRFISLVFLCISFFPAAIPKVRLEALYLCGVDDMSTKDIFGFFKEYPPAHIEWIDDASCE